MPQPRTNLTRSPRFVRGAQPFSIPAAPTEDDTPRSVASSTGLQRKFSAEQSADALLRQRFGAPPGPSTYVAPGHGGIDVNSYVGSRYAAPGATGAPPGPSTRTGVIPVNTGEVKDAPDLQVRMALNRRNAGQVLTPQEERRLAVRAQTEEQTARQGGRVLQPLPRETDPSAAYNQGRASARTLFSRPASSMSPQTGLKPAPYLAPPPPPQTESANPLSGDTGAPMEETDTSVPNASLPDEDVGQTLGFSQRGRSTPRGQDAQPSNVGGTGIYARRFSNPKAANLYAGYARRIFGDQDEA